MGGGGVTNNTCRCTIICIPRTNSPQELAAIYTAADVFAKRMKIITRLSTWKHRHVGQGWLLMTQVEAEKL